jgi:excisionase family DNA binding protein
MKAPCSAIVRLKGASDYISTSVWKIRNLIQRGELPIVQYGQSAPWLIDIADLDRWIEAHKIAK